MHPEDLIPKIDLNRLSDLNRLDEIGHRLGPLSFKDREFLREFRGKEDFKSALRSMPDPLSPWKW